MRRQLDDAFEAFEAKQPALHEYMTDILSRKLDETALALGYFLLLATWIAFNNYHGDKLAVVSDVQLQAADESLSLDEELRRAETLEVLDSDDVIALAQPHLFEFIHEHLDATLDAHADDVEVDDVHVVYRMILVVVLALSYSVEVPRGYSIFRTEPMA